MARPAIATTIRKDGPFFQHDPGKTFRANVVRLTDETLKLGKSDEMTQLRAGESGRATIRVVSPNRVSAHIKVVLPDKRAKKPTELTGVVKVDTSGMSTKQVIALMAAASEIQTKSKTFSRTATRLRAANKLNAAELLKGIA